MKIQSARFEFVLLFMGLLACDAGASVIRIGVQCAARFSKGQVTVNGTFINKGDETIESLQAEAHLGDADVLSEAFNGVGTGQVVQVSMVIDRLPEAKGMHTVMVRIRYTDVSGYPYTRLVPVPFVNGDPGFETALSGELDTIEISESGRMQLKVRSNVLSDLHVSYELVLPDEFGCEGPSGELLVPGGGAGDVHFDIQNRWGRAGSRYSVYAILNVLNGSVHQSEAIKGKVRISKYRAMPARARRFWWSLAGVLLAVCVALEIVAYKRERS